MTIKRNADGIRKSDMKKNYFAVYREPQSLFNRPEHVDNYKSISALKYKVNKAEVPQYVEEFEHVARDDVLMIANISLEEIQV